MCFSMFLIFVERTLRVNPGERPSAKDLCELIEALAMALSIDLSKPVGNLELPQLSGFSLSGIQF